MFLFARVSSSSSDNIGILRFFTLGGITKSCALWHVRLRIFDLFTLNIIWNRVNSHGFFGGGIHYLSGGGKLEPPLSSRNQNHYPPPPIFSVFRKSDPPQLQPPTLPSNRKVTINPLSFLPPSRGSNLQKKSTFPLEKLVKNLLVRTNFNFSE